METKHLQSEKEKKVWITITGFRTLVILKALLEGGKTVNQLVEILKKQAYLNKAVSKDTVRMAIKTLKSAGCEIIRPSKANKYLYELTYHPFHLNIDEEELEALITLRERLSQDFSWQDVLILNDLYDKIFALTFNNEQMEFISESKPLVNINKSILMELANPQIYGKKTSIQYYSPEFGLENIDIVPKRLSYNNGKLYLFCYSFKYNKTSMLNIERIVLINKIDVSESFETENSYSVIYSLEGNAFEMFTKADYEEIIEKTQNSITISAKVENEFLFIQRILMFGTDFKIISPEFFREKLIDKINTIRRRYAEQ